MSKRGTATIPVVEDQIERTFANFERTHVLLAQLADQLQRARREVRRRYTSPKTTLSDHASACPCGTCVHNALRGLI